MPKREIDLKAWVGDRVAVPALELREATVVSVSLTCDGPRYEVGYFHAGDRKTALLHADEFEVPSRPAAH